MHNQFKSQKFKHLMLAMGPRDLNSAPYRPVHCSSHSMTSFQSSELTELPVVENSQLFAQRAHNACTARAQRTVRPRSMQKAIQMLNMLGCETFAKNIPHRKLLQMLGGRLDTGARNLDLIGNSKQSL